MTSAMVRFAPAVLLVPMLACLAAPVGQYAVFRSTDRGRSWVRSDTGLPARTRLNAFAALGGTVFAGTDGGIYRSHDEARSWGPATGPAQSSGRIISLASLKRSVFAGTAGHGMWVSADWGESWTPSPRFPSPTVRCLLAHAGRLYAGTDAEGVFVSDDDGRVWVPLEPGFPAHAQVFALCAVHDRVFAGLYRQGLYAWDGQERRWRKAGEVSPLVLAGTRGTLVVGHNPGGLHWSDDLGATWSRGTARAIEPVAEVLPWDAGELSSEAPVWELASNADLVMAGAAAGIFYSEDRGRTWTRARAGLPPASPGISFLLQGTYVLAATTIEAGHGEPDPPAKVSPAARPSR